MGWHQNSRNALRNSVAPSARTSSRFMLRAYSLQRPSAIGECGIKKQWGAGPKLPACCGGSSEFSGAPSVELPEMLFCRSFTRSASDDSFWREPPVECLTSCTFQTAFIHTFMRLEDALSGIPPDPY